MIAPGPLAAIRVIDMGWSWAGPYAGMILADLGAEVIKVESTKRVDVLRSSGSFADNLRSYERSGYFSACNRGKLSCALNLKHPRAPEILLSLVAKSDVLLENFSPRVMPSLGLDGAALQARNPRLIVLSMSGYGANGPERDYTSYGDHLLHASGFASITGGEGDPHTKVGIFYGDPVGGTYGALGIIAALNQRLETGQGCRLELSQLEGLISLMPVEVMRTSAGIPVERSVDKRPNKCPHGFYACEGEDAWVSLSVRNDTEWQSLRELIVEDGLVVDEYPTLADRMAAADDIDAIVLGWTRRRSPWDITEICQAREIPAYPVESSQRLLLSDHLHSRNFFHWVRRAVVGPGILPGVTFNFDGDGADIRRPAPLLGEHNDHVYREILGLSDEEFTELLREEVLV